MPQTTEIPITSPSLPDLDSHQVAIAELRYSLDKRIPDMLRGFTITTCYGEINIDPEYAEAFRNLAFEVLQYQLNRYMTQDADECSSRILP